MVKGLGFICAVALGAVGTAQAQAQEIVIPADDPGYSQAAPQDGTDLVMKPYTVRDQNQLRGRYGSAWSEGEVKQRAAQTCAENGMQLIYFKPEARDAKGRTEFAAVCK